MAQVMAGSVNRYDLWLRIWVRHGAPATVSGLGSACSKEMQLAMGAVHFEVG